MALHRLRVVLDTNIVLRGLLSAVSASGKILRRCEDREIIILLSRDLLNEYRFILSHKSIQTRFPALTRNRSEAVLARLLYVGESVEDHRRFPFPRDPKDAKLLQLAIAGNASHLVTADKDMLSLYSGRDETAKRLRVANPLLQILPPDEFIQMIA